MTSPCIKQCRLVNDKCVGCGRTGEQIHYWSKMTEAERIKIIEKLKE